MLSNHVSSQGCITWEAWAWAASVREIRRNAATASSSVTVQRAVAILEV
jgi:hypothetical protein